MKYLVNGTETEMPAGDATIRSQGGRLLVLSPEGTHSAIAVRRGDTTYVSYRGRQYTIQPVKATRGGSTTTQSGELRSPMPGLVVDAHVQVGDRVVKGQKLLVLEAMKTQQTFVAPFDGTIVKLSVSKGEQIAEDIVMIVVGPAEENKIE